MIKAILIFNNHGKPRLSKFYQPYSEDTQQQIIRETFHLVSKRDENVCNFLEGGLLIGGSDNKLIYRHYATLYFVFCVDSSESELGILDLIQVHNILAEMVMGGMVLETNMNEIVTQIDAQNKLEKSELYLQYLWGSRKEGGITKTSLLQVGISIEVNHIFSCTSKITNIH
nr:AP-3 complex subunit sigma-1 isoform X4 [Symphalangus syndactylus]